MLARDFEALWEWVLCRTLWTLIVTCQSYLFLHADVPLYSDRYPFSDGQDYLQS